MQAHRKKQFFVLNIIQDTIEHLTYGWRVFTDPSEFVYAGVKIPLKATKELWKLRKVIFLGEYEAPELSALKDLIKPNDIVLELGAGVGVVSTFIALHLNNPANLHSFEANPSILKSIEAVAGANNVSFNVKNCAVAMADGELEFFFDDHFESSSMINRERGAKASKVPAVAFSNVLAALQPTVVVIDVEGAERELLDIQFPDSVRVICGEVHPHIIGDTAISKIFANLFAQGFDYHVDMSDGRGISFSRPAKARKAPAEPVGDFAIETS